VGEQCDAAEHQQCAQEVRIESKKKTYGYIERDELKRQEFQEQLQRKLPHQLVYVDEAGIDNREDYPYGYCKIGQRFYALKSGKRSERVSWIAALKEGSFVCANDLYRFLQSRLV
jgi:hypothetical protein